MTSLEIYDYKVEHSEEMKVLNNLEFEYWIRNAMETIYCDKKRFKGDRRTQAFKEFYNKANKELREYHKRVRDDYLRDELHAIQKYCESDVGSLKLISEDGNAIYLSVGGDVFVKYAVLTDSTKIPSYYKKMPFDLNGTYKIMAYDCSNNFSDNGELISGWHIEVFRSETSFIFFIIKD